MNILVIAPHPDDEVLGCGGTIKKHVEAGDSVYVCFVTKAYTPDWTEEYIENKRKETKVAVNLLGVKDKDCCFLDFPTVKLDTVPQKELNDSIAKVISEVKPQVAFIPFFGDINKDHKLVTEASLVALRPKPGDVVERVYSYEVLSETEWAGPPLEVKDLFLPNFYEDISKQLNFKLKAMECYRSELKDFPHPRSLRGIKALAEKRGTEAGMEAAEAFMLIRELKK